MDIRGLVRMTQGFHRFHVEPEIGPDVLKGRVDPTRRWA